MHKELKIYGNVAERFSKRFLAIKLLEKDVEIERMVKRWGELFPADGSEGKGYKHHSRFVAD